MATQEELKIRLITAGVLLPIMPQRLSFSGPIPGQVTDFGRQCFKVGYLTSIALELNISVEELHKCEKHWEEEGKVNRRPRNSMTMEEYAWRLEDMLYRRLFNMSWDTFEKTRGRTEGWTPEKIKEVVFG